MESTILVFSCVFGWCPEWRNEPRQPRPPRQTKASAAHPQKHNREWRGRPVCAGAQGSGARAIIPARIAQPLVQERQRMHPIGRGAPRG